MALLPLGLISQGDGANGGGAFELISTAYGTGSSGTITFSSIPATYTHLQLRATMRDDYTLGWNQPYFKFNSDATSSNYSWHQLLANGSSVTSSGAANTLIYDEQIAATYGGVSNSYATIIFDVLDYANTNKYKTARLMHGVLDGSLKKVSLLSGSWRNTAAVTSLAIINGNNFTTASRFSLYGIRGA